MQVTAPSRAKPGSRVALLAILAVMASFVMAFFAKPALAGTDDYPSPWRAPTAPDTVVDTWGEYNRECTSFAAFRLSARNGFTMPFHDNATGWSADAQARGYTVNMTPGLGSIAWWSSGHVAWVEAINGSNVTIEEYNFNFTHNYSERTIAANSVSGYIHFKDITPPPASTTYTIGDFDGQNADGKSRADIALYSPGVGFSVARGTSAGLSEAGAYLSWWGAPNWGGVGDFDGDNRSDIVFYNPGIGFSRALGTPTGFLESGAYLSWWGSPTWAGVGNFNGPDLDGKNRADIAFYTPGLGFSLAKGTATGFSEAGAFLPGWGTPAWAGAGDFDGDGKDDIAVYNPGIGFSVARGTTNGLSEGGAYLSWWGSPTWAGVGNFNGPDLDGKNRADIAFYTPGYGLSLALGTANGFSEAGLHLTGWGGLTWGGVGDYDGDGKSDVAFYTPGIGFSLARGTSNGFSEVGAFLPGWGGLTWGGWGMFPGTKGNGFPKP